MNRRQTSPDECLRAARILVVGLGGLGAPAALHLARAGVGRLGLMDFDCVDVSNLHRQIIYRTSDLGRPKAAVAAERLTALRPGLQTECLAERLSPRNLPDIFRRFDFVIDGTDQTESKYLVNDGAVMCRVPYSHAGIMRVYGQTTTVIPGQSACLRCLFPSPPVAGEIPTCEEAGILGPIAGSIGLVQAAEALKYVLHAPGLLADRLLTYDAGAGRWRVVRLSRNRGCPVCGDQPSIVDLHAGEAVQNECR